MLYPTGLLATLSRGIPSHLPLTVTTEAGSLPSGGLFCPPSQVPRRVPASASEKRTLSVALPSYERLGPPQRLSADNLTGLQPSLNVTARCLAPSSSEVLIPRLNVKLSPHVRGLLPGAPTLTRTGLSPVSMTQFSGHTIRAVIVSPPAPEASGRP